ncbi:MAG TPA: hypothetical protein VF637_07975 [Sphingomicrobium sp.]|jgi:hypothetical protein
MSDGASFGPGSQGFAPEPALPSQPIGADPSRWLEVRPDYKGKFDEIVARFADGIVHVEMMTNKSVYIGFYCDDGRAHQLWISSDKKLFCNEADASGPPPRFTAWGADRRDSDEHPTGEDAERLSGEATPARAGTGIA